MTLVVARQFADAPRLVADTQLTDPLGKRVNPYNRGALKLVILHRSLCIGFDGGEITGRKAILDVGRDAAVSFNLAQVRRRLTLASRESSNGSSSPASRLVPHSFGFKTASMRARHRPLGLAISQLSTLTRVTSRRQTRCPTRSSTPINRIWMRSNVSAPPACCRQ